MNTETTDHAVYEMDNREYWRTRVNCTCESINRRNADYRIYNLRIAARNNLDREPRQPLWWRLLVGAAIAVALSVLLEVWR
jgi:hypothetical protein